MMRVEAVVLKPMRTEIRNKYVFKVLLGLTLYWTINRNVKKHVISDYNYMY